MLVADIDELEILDASEKHARRLNTKVIITRKNGEHFICPIADGTVKLAGGDQDLRTSTLIRDHPSSRRTSSRFSGRMRRSPPTHLQDSLPDAGEARNDFWSFTGDFICRHHVGPSLKLHTPRAETLSIPLKYLDVSTATHTTLDVGKSHR